MEKLKKYIPFLSSILGAIFMFNIGFSSWLILIRPDVASNGSFSAYEVSEHISSSGTIVFQYNSLSFVKSGAESDDGEIVCNYIIFPQAASEDYSDWQLAFNLSCKNTVSDSDDYSNWQVAFNLSCKNTVSASDDLFTQITTTDGKINRRITAIFALTQGSKTATIEKVYTGSDGRSLDTVLTKSELDKAGFDVSASTDPTKPTPSITATLTYMFEIPKNDPSQTDVDVPSNFRQNFGKYLKNFENNKTEFITTAQVEEVTG